MRILGPLVCATTSPVTATLASASRSVVTSSPSTSSRAGRSTLEPGSPTIFSTSTTSPTATLYCLPPVLTMAYIDDCSSGVDRAKTGPPHGGPVGQGTDRAEGGSNRPPTQSVDTGCGGPAGRLAARRRRLGATLPLTVPFEPATGSLPGCGPGCSGLSSARSGPGPTTPLEPATGRSGSGAPIPTVGGVPVVASTVAAAPVATDSSGPRTSVAGVGTAGSAGPGEPA